MNTKEAFQYLIDSWKTQPKPLKKKWKQQKYNFTHDNPLSADKMAEILLDAGWKIRSELTWTKPKKPSQTTKIQ